MIITVQNRIKNNGDDDDDDDKTNFFFIKNEIENGRIFCFSLIELYKILVIGHTHIYELFFRRGRANQQNKIVIQTEMDGI
mgnify:CR=1 FL=1